MYDLEPYLKKIEEIIQSGPYLDAWESLMSYETPKWYSNAKFGIFVHWGVYSVPAFGSEWYSRNMYIKGSKEYEHHIKTYGKHKDFGYKDFIPMFKADRFMPEEWMNLFKLSGAKYVVPVAEHHDGFQMYKSEISEWNAYEKGPKRDILKELGNSAEQHDLIFGASSHRVEHWFFMGNGKKFESDIFEPMQRGDFYWPAMEEKDHYDLFSEPIPTKEFLDDWLVRTCEIIDRFSPQVLYFDWWIQHQSVRPYLKKVAAYYYNQAYKKGQEVVINYKHDAFMFGTAVPDVERGQFADVKPYYWQTDTAISLNSWCYTEMNEYRLAVDIIRDLVDIVSKNGNLLLNVGPKADGTISKEETQILLEIGKWLQINGEAIYGSKTWRKYGEGPTKIVEGQFSDKYQKNFTDRDIRFTVAGGYLYATVMAGNATGKYIIESLGIKDASKEANFSDIISKIDVLGSQETVKWDRTQDGLIIETQFQSEYPIVFRIRMK